MSPPPVALAPMTIWLDAAAILASASFPIITLSDPDVIATPALFPEPVDQSLPA